MFLLLPVCPNGPKPPAWLKGKAVENGFHEYHLVPQTYLDGFGRAEVEKSFVVTEETEYEDYVYLSANLAGLPGRDYAKKRNLVQQFERLYLEPGLVKADAITPANAGECLACLEAWRNARGDKDWSGLLECERQAITKALKNFAAEFDKLKIKFGYLNNERFDEAGVIALADLPSMDVLRSKLLGLFNAPATKLATLINTPATLLAQVIKAKAEKAE